MHFFLKAAASFNPNTDESLQISRPDWVRSTAQGTREGGGWYLQTVWRCLSGRGTLPRAPDVSDAPTTQALDRSFAALYGGKKNYSGVKMEALNWISTHVRRWGARGVRPRFDPPCLRSPLISGVQSGRQKMCLAAINQMRSIFSPRGPTERRDWWRRSVRLIGAHLVDDFHFVNNHERR